MKEIPLTKGYVAYVDDEDYEKLLPYNWYTGGHGPYLYAVCKSRRGLIRMHRLIMGVTNKDIHIDHINHKTLDNRKENLRLCSNKQNRHNTKKHKDNQTGFKGVSKRTNYSGTNPYKASIMVDRKEHHLGSFSTPEKAHEAYCFAAHKYHGEFAHSGE